MIDSNSTSSALKAPALKKKKPNHRLGVEGSETGAHLIRSAARLIRDEGCAAVTARRLAEELGLKRQIVHYYIGTIEDLLIEVIRRSVDKIHERVRRELESEQPLGAIYQLATVSSTLFEFSALAMRSKAIRTEMQRYMDSFHKTQSEAIGLHLERRGITPNMAPKAIAFITNSVAHTLALEASLGVTEGHRETVALMEDWLTAFAQTGDWYKRDNARRPDLRLIASRDK